MSRRKLTTPEFIVKAEAVHGKYYGYDEVDYKGTVEKITIICPEHGGFHQTPKKHLSGSGCKMCSIKSVAKLQSSNTEKFIKKAEAVHGKHYDYSSVDYKGSVEKITIICPEHGGFHQTPNDHLKGKGCPICCKYGYRPNKPGNFYVQKLFKNNDLYAIKFGITNKIVESRMKQQNSKSCFTHKLFEELYF